MRRTRGLVVMGALVAFATVATAATASDLGVGQGYKVVGKWGKDGSGNGQFVNARGIAVDDAGNVYVADTDNNRVQVFTAKGTFVRKWGSIGDGNGQFLGAEDVDIAPDGTVWVADRGNERLQQFSSSGDFMTSIGLPFGDSPLGVSVDADGKVYAAANGSERSGYRRYVKTATGWEASGGLFGAGPYRAEDVEASLDGTIYLTTNNTGVPYDARIRRYSADGKALGSIKRTDVNQEIGIDLDCNVWAAEVPQRRMTKLSPSGKLLATASVPDLIALGNATGPKGDLYVIHQNAGIVHFAEDKSKPATANVTGRISVHGGKATIRYGATGFACPARADAVATLTGKGVSGKANVQVAAGKFNSIAMNVKAPVGQTVPAVFKIVLKTNGRPTTEKKSVRVSFSK